MMRALLRALAWAYLLGLAATVLLLHYVGEEWWLTQAALYLPRAPLGLPLLLFVPACLLQRAWRCLAGQAVAALLWLFPLMGLVLPRLHHPDPGDKPSVRVMSYNVWFGRRGNDAIWSVVTEAEPDVVALQAVTAGDEVTQLMAKLEQDGEFAEQLFVHGLGVQTAEGMAEWLHAKVRSDLQIPPSQGRRYSWGYPACPEQSEHEKVFRLLDAPQVGLRLSGGYAVEPEQSTLAIVAHHPQAVYFGMKSGFLPKGERQAADDLIAGSDRDPTRLAELSDAEKNALSHRAHACKALLPKLLDLLRARELEIERISRGP